MVSTRHLKTCSQPVPEVTEPSNNDKPLASMSPKTGCTPGSGVRCWLRLQRSVLSFSFNSCLHQHHPATCLFVATWYYWPGTPRAVFLMFIQCGNTKTLDVLAPVTQTAAAGDPFPHPFETSVRAQPSHQLFPLSRAGNRDCHHPKSSWDSVSQRHKAVCLWPHGFRAGRAQMVWDGLSPQPCQGNSQKSQDFTECS